MQKIVMWSDKKISLFGGFFVFVVSLVVYVFTLEPTTSFWDCGEFISCAYKLEVPHPPGAPFFLLLGRFFSLFAGGNTEWVAFCVNMLSAIASSLTIMFLFWTIEWFAEKLSQKNRLLIFGSALIGSLAYAFTDSFWFSAVEGEVYATSSLLTAIVFWAILKWEKEYGVAQSARWILLIFFLLGASIGIHLLNLLAIPAISLVIYSKTKDKSKKNGAMVLVSSFLVLGVIVFGFIPGIAKIASFFDLFLVNTFSAPFNSGLILTSILLFVISIYIIKFSARKKNYLLYLGAWSFLMMFIGFSSYSVVVIRSSQNTPINMSRPDNPFSLLHYLNREQYGSRSLIYGPYYNAKIKDFKQRDSYVPLNGKYEKEKLNPKLSYDDRSCTFFPRMGSSEQAHIEAYKKWGNIKNVSKPTFANNITFFFRYQIGHMYYRYFMWNFVGRQNDIQGFGEKHHGNWISGIGFIDTIRLGSQDEFPDFLKRNRGRNTYFFLPLILGLMGAIFQYKRNKPEFFIILLLFIFTGLAIVVYLNEIPITPRERDYVYVGSFYAFAIWIGLGVFSLFNFLKTKIRETPAQWAALIFACASAPILLIQQNWDDHNRSNRYVAREVAKNYLQSCDKNAILLTTADNDTYPLWYAQEVEGFRTDIRQALLPYFSANWYNDGARKNNQATSGLPIRFTAEKLVNGQRDYVYVVEKTKEALDAGEVFEFVNSDSQKAKIRLSNGKYSNYIPTRKLKYRVNKENFLSSFNYKNCLPDSIPAYFNVTLPASGVYKSDLIVLDIIANNNWERPVYFVNKSLPQKLGFEDYILQEGLVYRLAPYKVGAENYNTEKNYELLMNRFAWGNLNNTSVYIDNTINRTAGLVLRVRKLYTELAENLLKEGKRDEAKKVLRRAEIEIPPSRIGYNYFDLDTINLLLSLNEKKKAVEIFTKMIESEKQFLDFCSKLKKADKFDLALDIKNSLYILKSLENISNELGENNHKKLSDLLNVYFEEFAQVIS